MYKYGHRAGPPPAYMKLLTWRKTQHARTYGASGPVARGATGKGTPGFPLAIGYPIRGGFKLNTPHLISVLLGQALVNSYRGG